MPDTSLPEGTYLSVANNIRTTAGGQTRAILLRNRLFTTHAGVPTTILTFDDAPVYPAERVSLAERGELVPGMRLLNIFEHYRAARVADGDGPPLAEPAGLRRLDVAHPDGTVHYTGWRVGDAADDVVRDYRRADGSVFLRAPGPAPRPRGSGPWPEGRWVLLDHAGRVAHAWSRRSAWTRHWLRALAGAAERVFVISDGRFAVEKVLPFADPRFHLLHLMHNVHVHGDRAWNARLSPNYTVLLGAIDQLDGLVALTERQREDVAERFGATDNLFTVPNPVTPPPLPEPLPPRAAARFAVVSRFDEQKRVDHAVRVFARVVAARPQARLDVYGVGPSEPAVRALVERLGLTEQVRLHGWDPDARDTLWDTTAFLLTSAHEGYPLATLESMARGCPVVAYDIKYGPRDQVTDGVDGYLVADGDQQTMAERLVGLVDDPALVARLSAAARRTAEGHDHRAFLGRWGQVLRTVVAQRAERVRLDEVGCTVTTLGVRRAGARGALVGLGERLPTRVREHLPAVASGAVSVAGGGVLEVAVTLTVRGRWPRGALARARLSLDAVSRTGPLVTALPLTVRRSRRTVELRSRVPLASLFEGRPAAERAVGLRLRLVLANASWETMLHRAAAARPTVEVVFDADDRLTVQRR